eukprot:CAMPEP_0172749122 /NCGR_PEP_ID=MMETSP1074-20121228/146595_1 /TAXON_ID=2916 /ORGANISM="Ceratium fusus, Strain PA161109" /LENGTH=173 /DNA_ID=CAMNT_0013581007 /DNA_START=58 /DNA_END=574 /DNA_ORIENTATION=+
MKSVMQVAAGFTQIRACGESSSDVRAQPLVRAVAPDCNLESPLRIVDAMAGLGGTALRMAHACGRGCHVTASEVSAPLACLLHFGLQRLASQGEDWSEPAQRVEALCADAEDFLRERGRTGPSFDVVYLNPCLDISALSKEDLLLQRLARQLPVTQETFEAAVACASRRVVLR